MPPILTIAAGAGHVQEDAPKSGVSEPCLHNDPIGWNSWLLEIVLVTMSNVFPAQSCTGFRQHAPEKTKWRRPGKKGRRRCSNWLLYCTRSRKKRLAGEVSGTVMV